MTLHWKLNQTGTSESKRATTSAAVRKALREREWISVRAGDECVVTVELTRTCLRGKVHT